MTEVQRPAVTGQLLCQRYRLQELIGRGAAAAVYRALDEVLSREVALKVFSKEGGEPELLARQEAEIRILAPLIHPSLVTLFDAGTDPTSERTFVVMEYVPGPDLRRHLRDGAMAPADIAKMGSDIASALNYVHARGVIHRDIKPSNVLLYPRSGQAGARWRAKLADFGIARVMEEDHLTRTGRTVGTAAYLSPEQALGKPLDGASDVYSLGLVLLECFTRQVEFPGNHIESGVARIHRDPVIPDTIGADWNSLLAAMTARQSAERPTAAEAAAALKQLALRDNAPRMAPPPAGRIPTPGFVTARPPLPPRSPAALPHARKPGKRGRAVIGAALAAVILTGATTATFGGSGPDQAAAPAGQAIPVHNNPVDYHLDQLEAALQSTPALLPLVKEVRQAVTAGNLDAGLAHLHRLEKDATDEAARNGLTFEQFRSVINALRLVRNDLQTLLASADSSVEALPAAIPPAPEANPDPAPAVIPEPAPVIIVNPVPAAPADREDPVQQEHEDLVKQEPGQADDDAPIEAGPDDKPKQGKPDKPGDGKNNKQ
ncbi:serine/threonine protein kinase [Pseudarthrobacter sp. NamE2]|uniref:serine/threonine-protein kinase n=1 Tax=Pseudarthrobacter sp. NamE2 TaxID=2576838 RepID=UPI0010FDA350|nr:serine/threonine-protein kinase [Pseudarthrobacter sp. NamE2]TLM86580.1 serine/threonine protein kinase [Pseudarthrobacter sp. NamE2]